MILEEEKRIQFSIDDEETLVAQGMKEKDNLKATKVKMDEVREENERLKLKLSQMMKDYHSLKMQFNDMVQVDQFKVKSTDPAAPPMAASDDDDESRFVSLSLGGSFSGDSRRLEKKTSSIRKESKKQENSKLDGLELALECKCDSDNNICSEEILTKNPTRPERNSSDERKEDGNNEMRASHNSPKNSRGDDEILQHNPMKKPRVSVRAVCNTQTMNDGCQWRKYGQKIAKGNPCPRAYYRCTVSSSCPVRKQVQRCVDDMKILITTYEGTHNHPLLPSATTMASATSAAAAMLNCGSSASPPEHGISATSSTSPNLLGFSFTSSNNLTTCHFPRATTSTSQSHPTVILDLTAPTHPLTNSFHYNNKFSTSLFSAAHSSPASLNFSSSNSCFDPNSALNIGWDAKFPSIRNVSSSYNSKHFVFNNKSTQVSHEQTANDQKIAAATKAITCDPTFQSALAAAITSFVGSNVQGRNPGLDFHPSFSESSKSNGGIGCATSFMNKFPQSVNSLDKNSTLFSPVTLSTPTKSQSGEGPGNR